MTEVEDTLRCILDLNPPHHGHSVPYNWTEPTMVSSSSSRWPRIQGLEPLPLLHLAAQEGFLPAAEMLISHGADIELPDGNVRTPLAIAAAEGKLNMTKYLLDKGAMVDPLDRYGWTPLMLATARQSRPVPAPRGHLSRWGVSRRCVGYGPPSPDS